MKTKANNITLVGISLLLIASLSGCVVAGGYTSSGGWFIWPGSFVLFVILVMLFLLFRRRR